MSQMNDYEAHVTDEWQRNTMVIQVRKMTATGSTIAAGQVLEDRDGMPVMEFKPMTPEQVEGREHLVPTPGIRLPHDVAVAMARAILTEAGKDADEVERLKATVDDMLVDAARMSQELSEAHGTISYLSVQNTHLERLVESTEAHLEREARMADHFHESLEHDRREQRHEQARRHHPSRSVLGDALEGSQSFASALRKVGEAVNRTAPVDTGRLGL